MRLFFALLSRKETHWFSLKIRKAQTAEHRFKYRIFAS